MVKWISIGQLGDLDPTEGNHTSESASDLSGVFDNDAMSFVNASSNNVNDDDIISENSNGNGETITIDGVTSGLDSIQQYYATITLGDGTTVNSSLGVAQLENGQAYIVPTSHTQLDNLKIQSIEFTGIHTDDFNGMYVTSAARSIDNTEFVCFASGTQIKTGETSRAIETLERGQMLLTMDNGLQPIRWIGHTRLNVTERTRPIRIERNALGNGLPNETLIVSPQHRVLIRSKIADRMFGNSEVLVPAKKLVGFPGISPATDIHMVTYWHVLLDRHEIIFSNETPAESLYSGPMAMRAMGDQAREELLLLFPDLRDQTFRTDPAREFLRGKAIDKLLERHVKNKQPLTTLNRMMASQLVDQP